MNRSFMGISRFAVWPLFAVLLSPIAFGQTETSLGLVIDKTSHDFGRIRQREKHSATFSFRNEGKDSIFVQQPRASCGCTAALLTKGKLGPNDTGSINVTFVAYPGSSAKVSKTIDVFIVGSDGQERKFKTLGITAYVVGDVVTDETFLRYEGTTGETKELRIKVRSNTDKPVKLDNLDLSLMEYQDTTAGIAYHADKVIAIPVTDFTVRPEKEELLPEDSTYIVIRVPAHEKGQINGNLRIILPESEVRIGISGVISRRRL